MVATGKKLKSKNRTEQSKNGELGLIIDEFGRAMWRANREYIAHSGVEGSMLIRLTPAMETAWFKFVTFCMRNLK